MEAKFKFILMLASVLVVFILLQVFIFMNHSNLKRTRSSLINQYYSLQQTDPLAAKRTLETLLKENPNDQATIRELAYWYLRQGDIRAALTQFEYAHQHDPKDTIATLELGKLYLELKQPNKAYALLDQVKSTVNSVYARKASQLLNGISMVTNKTTPILEKYIQPSVLIPVPIKPTKQIATVRLQKTQTTTAPIIQISKRDQMMNKFYEVKKKNAALAYQLLQQILNRYPDDVQALKEGGYYALLKVKNNRLALYYFLRVYEITQDPTIAMQLAYIYSELKDQRQAYYYFDLARETNDCKELKTAELSKSSLRGIQTKLLPHPYYMSLDVSPLYMSRFKLLIYPIIFQFGRYINEQFHWKVYLSYRRTSDNKSQTSSIISNIFQDNAAITAIGTQLTPIPSIPSLVALVEVGKANDLVYRRRARWRSDLRYGFAYYNEWGRPIEYTFKPTFMLKFNADVYGDAIYYNRYHDGIATLRARPGFRIFRFNSTSLNIYYKGFIVEDQAREFYNNLIESGPGFALTLSDRYNIVLRYEMLHGHYLPANSPSRNPYKPNYHNTIVELDTYFEF